MSLDWIYSNATTEPFIASDSSGFVKLACNEKDAKIHYTLDNTIPINENSKLYEEPIAITKTTNLYMQAFSSEKTSSEIVFSKIGTDVFQPAQKLLVNPKPGLEYNYYECEINSTSEIQKNQSIEKGIVSNFSLLESCR